MHDGGPAFPQNDAAVNRINNLDGMSLRDYFAAAALQGIMSTYIEDCDDDKRSPVIVTDGPEFVINHADGAESIARSAYELADAMLAARERNDEPA